MPVPPASDRLRSHTWNLPACFTEAVRDTGKYNKAVLTSAVFLVCSQAALAQSTVYWDGADTVADGTVDGGDGTWDAATTNWTSSSGDTNYSADGLGALAIRVFSGTGGTVNVSSLTAQATQLRFSTSGYRLTGEDIDVQGPLLVDANIATTIGNRVASIGLTSAATSTLTVDEDGELQISKNSDHADILSNISNNGILTFDIDGEVNLRGAMTGAGLIRQQGDGSLRLWGSNGTASYDVEILNGVVNPGVQVLAGTVTFDGGGLQISSSASTSANFIMKDGGGELDLEFGTYGIKSVISGSGKLTKSGIGTLRLEADNNFTGGFDVQEGTVALYSAVTPLGVGLVTLGDARILVRADANLQNDFALSSDALVYLLPGYNVVMAGDINMAGDAGFLEINPISNGATSTMKLSGSLSNGGFAMDLSDARLTGFSLEFAGTTANTYTGLTRFQTIASTGFQLKLNKSANVVAVPGSLTVDAGTQVVIAADEQIANTSTVLLQTGAGLTLSDGAAVTETIAVLNGSGAVNLRDLSEIRLASGTFSGDGSLVKQGNGTLILAGDNTFTGATSNADGLLQLGAGSTSGALAGNIANNGQLVFDRSDDSSYVGVISGTGSVTQDGDGELTLSGNNTYTGTTTIGSDATLRIGAGGTSGAVAGTITNNGVLVFDRADRVDFGTRINGTGVVRQQGAGELVLSGQSGDPAYTYNGNVEIIAGRFSWGQVTLGGGVILNGGTIYPGVTSPPVFPELELQDNGGTIETISTTWGLGNNVSGTGKLTKTGAQTLRISGDKTFSGGVDINQGNVSIVDSSGALSSPLGSGPVTMAANTSLSLRSEISLANNISLADTSELQLYTGVGIEFSGNINLGGMSEFLRLIPLTGGGATADQKLAFAGVLSNGGFIVDASDVRSNTPILEFNGAAANTYTGLTRIQTASDSGLRFKLSKTANIVAVPADLTVDEGTEVIIATDEQIANTSTVLLQTNAELTLGDGAAVTETIGVLNGTGVIGLTEQSELRVASGTFAGVISGNGSVKKQDNGMLILSGANLYTGDTSVAGGELRVSGSLTSSVTVESGATLSGTGTVAAVQAAAGANVAPGASAGTLSTGSMTLNATSVLNFELNAPGTVGGSVNDLIQISGDLTLDGVLNISDLGDFAAGTYTLFTYTGNLTNNALTINNKPPGFLYSIDATQAHVIKLEVVTPESALTLSATELDFGVRRINAAAASQVLTISNAGNVAVNVGTLTVSGDHASDFSIAANSCSNIALPVSGECSVTISQEGDTSGVRTAQVNIPSDADDNPHVAALQVRMVGDPILSGLDGTSQIFTVGAGPLLLDPTGSAVITMPGALNLDGGTLSVTMINGANAAEDKFSFSTTGDVSLSGGSAGSDVLVNEVVIGTLDNPLGAGEVLSVTFNESATIERVQTLIQAINYQNINSANPVNGEREARVTLSYLDQDVTATVTIDIQSPAPEPVVPPVTSPVTVITGGTVSGDVSGDPETPTKISGATITGDASLAHVIIAADVILEPGVTLGEGVIFESPGMIDDIQSITTSIDDGATVIQQLDSGHIIIIGDGYRAELLAVEIVQASPGQKPGIYFGDNGDILFITASGLGIRGYALHVDSSSFQGMLADMALHKELTKTGRMLITPLTGTSAEQTGGGTVEALQSEENYYSGRADLLAVPATRGDTPGLVAYPVAGLGTLQHLSSLFVLGDDGLMQQDLVPAPADWSALHDALSALSGVTSVSIDTRGIIYVSIDGINMRGVMDYTVVRATDGGAGELSLEPVGDLTGNGMTDYLVTYGNGDKQYLFVYR